MSSNLSVIKNRFNVINKIIKLSQTELNFKTKSEKIEEFLSDDIKKNGLVKLIYHLRTCGDIPENFNHDSTEEKLYSKYTDCLLSECFQKFKLQSKVLEERSDSADVEAIDNKNNYSFVADAKAFRLSRTAKNQKDFKIQAMHSWKNGNDFAVVVCPIYQVPNNSSQIYKQSTESDVLILTYTHLIIILLAIQKNKTLKANDLFYKLFKLIEGCEVNDKSASVYWNRINQTIINFSEDLKNIYISEKPHIIDNIDLLKKLSVKVIDKKISIIKKYSKEKAISELIKSLKFDNNKNTIQNIISNNILDL